MADETVKFYVGIPDLNGQFSPQNIYQTLAYYEQISDSQGDYTFGDLTTKLFHLQGDEKRHWQSDITKYPRDIQNEIKRHVIAALTHVDDQGNPSPVPLTFDWPTTTGQKMVTCTYDQSGPSYLVQIFGLPKPLSTRLAERRAKYQKS